MLCCFKWASLNPVLYPFQGLIFFHFIADTDNGGEGDEMSQGVGYMKNDRVRATLGTSFPHWNESTNISEKLGVAPPLLQGLGLGRSRQNSLQVTGQV
ncbi:hypothetical protein BO78DRAFT_3644 [Aspergillus sclerotiicarbonarius CBS 121057]|uniref:Uncharacterized protein n=1 Tax=Aspergillus sclerotiicarbonarius (strain CBS 121057 / IBT 28362) TaxID=1448318 RepID=A0A319F367_ASPSB|nr:hypothetical protein BO78DRAFT_3644 [Aspergillus sclerotiicarbonarius CBS 121057]